MVYRFLILVCALLGVSIGGACDRAEAPSGAFTGSWVGTVVENPRGPGAIRLVLEHKGTAIDGTMRTTFQNVIDRDGPVQGVETASGATLTFVPAQPVNCGAAGTLTGTVTFTLALAAGRLTGSYAQFTCTGAVTAILDLGMG